MTEPFLMLNKDADCIKGKQAACFSFSSCHYDAASGEAELVYDIDGKSLIEKITFPWAPWPVDASRQAAFYKALELLHVIAGISYYKTSLAARIDSGAIAIDDVMAAFLNELYQKGLAEFAYTNKLDLTGLIDFKVNSGEMPLVTESSPGDLPGEHLVSHPVDLPERALVAMGGGKDSLVCLQMLREAGVEVQPACVGGSALIGETVKAAGLPLIRIQRELSTELTKMNAKGAWNGHVPVTAINSAILLCASLLYGYRFVVFANESSANEATLTDRQGREINHQYSKSLSFEQGFSEVIKQNVTPDIDYFSLLRPLSEIAITQRFTELTEFHEIFSSCNRNFHQDGSHITGRWCQNCPKCRFTALALALFLSPQQLLTIQGADLLDQAEQLSGFKALCGLGSHKPFECVGSIAECRSAMRVLANDPRWQGKNIVAALAGLPEIEQAGELELRADLKSGHCIPDNIMDKLNAF